MGIGNIGKLLANQALETTKKSMIESVMGSDAAKPAAPDAAKALPVATFDVGSIITGQIQAMQRPLRDDQELQVSVSTAHEVLRINEIFVPNSAVLVFSGLDSLGNITRILTPADQVQLVCKIVNLPAGTPAKRVNVLTPRPRNEAMPGAPAGAPPQNS